MKRNFNNKLAQLEEKLNYKESDDFVRYVYFKLVIQELSDSELDELIELGNKDLSAMSLKHDELIKRKMNQVKYGDIDQEFIERERKLFN